MKSINLLKTRNPVLRVAIPACVFSFAVLAGARFRIWLFGEAKDPLFFLVAFPSLFLLGNLIGWKGDGSIGDTIWEWVYPPPTDDWPAFLFFSLTNALRAALLFAILWGAWQLVLRRKHYLPEK